MIRKGFERVGSERSARRNLLVRVIELVSAVTLPFKAILMPSCVQVRPWTYFEDGVVSHVGFADPFDNELRKIIFNAVEGKGVLEGENVKMHETGLLVCMGM